eukprot:3005659-Pleurochrysis_carterae.AAC.2
MACTLRSLQSSVKNSPVVKSRGEMKNMTRTAEMACRDQGERTTWHRRRRREQEGECERSLPQNEAEGSASYTIGVLCSKLILNVCETRASKSRAANLVL